MDQKKKKLSAFVRPYDYSHNPEIPKRHQTFQEPPPPLPSKRMRTCECSQGNNKNTKKKSKIEQ